MFFFKKIFIVARNMLWRTIRRCKLGLAISSVIHPLVNVFTFLPWHSISSCFVEIKNCIAKLLKGLPSYPFYHLLHLMLQGLAQWNYNRGNGHSETRQKDLAITRHIIRYSLNSFIPFFKLVSMLWYSIHIARNKGFYISYLHKTSI